MTKTRDLTLPGLKFGLTICQVCDREVCFYKGNKRILSHCVPVPGEFIKKWGHQVPATNGTRCPGAGQKRIIRLLRCVEQYGIHS